MDDVDLDARGLICPLPVLRLRKRLLAMPPGGVLTMLADDPVAAIDIPHFCHEAGHALLETRDLGDARWFAVRRGDQAPEG
ncbi:SirA family protein [Pseudooceanicola batsensis HTCC2597]|uniref:SirA family protein n=1 Tax=Pseudooceanicola batsensis (strain ATCC BAA-863 / DSM 15984 / KCTC 12145 / HTCC2597) TaxID=252305 RepID=A3TXA6_PSEBH|nr:sulfurtransferase TusA family protein [Pseudooceanicola batsensis]EAQ03466.1 SirA family protein [Pseudooceanicola batsensis HTCC2597]